MLAILNSFCTSKRGVGASGRRNHCIPEQPDASFDLSQCYILSVPFDQLLLMLEGLVAERNRLNEALQAERQLYSSLVKFHTHPDR